MAETNSKRQREETQMENIEESKRHKSYNQILSLLEEEEDESTQDLSSLISTLQQELSEPTQKNYDQDLENPNSATSSSSSSTAVSKEDEEDDKESVIRHLLEASDDELGIPNREFGFDDGEDEMNGGDGFSLCDGLWELEDEAANYYSFLQSELFL